MPVSITCIKGALCESISAYLQSLQDCSWLSPRCQLKKPHRHQMELISNHLLHHRQTEPINSNHLLQVVLIPVPQDRPVHPHHLVVSIVHRVHSVLHLREASTITNINSHQVAVSLVIHVLHHQVDNMISRKLNNHTSNNSLSPMINRNQANTQGKWVLENMDQ